MKTIILGNEYEVSLIEKVKKIILEEGGVFHNKVEGHSGSQEVEVWEIILHDIVLVLEIETYIGISITGPPNVVDRIADKVR